MSFKTLPKSMVQVEQWSATCGSWATCDHLTYNGSNLVLLCLRLGNKIVSHISVPVSSNRNNYPPHRGAGFPNYIFFLCYTLFFILLQHIMDICLDFCSPQRKQQRGLFRWDVSSGQRGVYPRVQAHRVCGVCVNGEQNTACGMCQCELCYLYSGKC